MGRRGDTGETRAEGQVPGVRHVRRQVPGLGRRDHIQGRLHSVFRRRQGHAEVLFQPEEIRPRQNAADIRAIHVTDYYRLEPIDGRRAFYVAGSDVYGPMGKELIPFEKEAEAQEFMKDHKGKTVLPFDQIDLSLVMGLD